MKLTLVLLPIAALLVLSVSGAPKHEETESSGHGLGVMVGGLKKLMKKLPTRESFGFAPPPPQPQITPGITTIFYSPFFPVLPPQIPTSNNYGTPYGQSPPYASYTGTNTYQQDDVTVVSSQQQQPINNGLQNNFRTNFQA